MVYCFTALEGNQEMEWTDLKVSVHFKKRQVAFQTCDFIIPTSCADDFKSHFMCGRIAMANTVNFTTSIVLICICTMTNNTQHLFGGNFSCMSSTAKYLFIFLQC